MSWMRWFRRRGVVCRDFTELVTAYLDEALDRRTMRGIDRHLAGCAACTRYLEQFRVTIRLTGELRDTDVAAVDPDTRAELMAAFTAATGGRD